MKTITIIETVEDLVAISQNIHPAGSRVIPVPPEGAELRICLGWEGSNSTPRVELHNAEGFELSPELRLQVLEIANAMFSKNQRIQAVLCAQ